MPAMMPNPAKLPNAARMKPTINPATNTNPLSIFISLIFFIYIKIRFILIRSNLFANFFLGKLSLPFEGYMSHNTLYGGSDCQLLACTSPTQYIVLFHIAASTAASVTGAVRTPSPTILTTADEILNTRYLIGNLDGGILVIVTLASAVSYSLYSDVLDSEL
jgi:hypothetical protein